MTCAVEGCEKRVRARDLCANHYAKWARTGTPLGNPRVLQPCGTMAAYNRHVRNREPACEPCLEAGRERAKTKRSAHPRQLQPCGTVAAWQRHRKRGEQPCKACREAQRAYVREFERTRFRRLPKRRAACGTYAGWQRHLRRKETPCGRCAQAKRAYQRSRYRRRSEGRVNRRPSTQAILDTEWRSAKTDPRDAQEAALFREIVAMLSPQERRALKLRLELERRSQGRR